MYKTVQFNQVLTAKCIDWHIENSKNDKKVILFSSTLTLVMVANITFLSFLPFSMLVNTCSR